MGIGRKIRDKRKELGLTQTELAYAITSASTISLIETETIKPNMDIVKLLAERLNLPLDELKDNSSKEEPLFGEWMASIEHAICEMSFEEASEKLLLLAGADSAFPSAADQQMMELFSAQILLDQGNQSQAKELLKQFEDKWMPVDRFKQVNALYLYNKAACLMDEGSQERAFHCLDLLDNLKQFLPERYTEHLMLLTARRRAHSGDFLMSYQLLHQVKERLFDQGRWVELCKAKIIKSTIDVFFHYRSEAHNELVSTEKMLILLGECRLLNLVYYHLGRIAHQNGHLEEAIASLSKCVQMDQVTNERLTADVELELAQIYYEQNRFDKALEYANKAMSSSSSCLTQCNIYLLMAAVKGKGKKKDEQEQALLAAKQAASASHNTWLIKKCDLLLGHFYYDSGSYGKSSLFLIHASTPFRLDQPFYPFERIY